MTPYKVPFETRLCKNGFVDVRDKNTSLHFEYASLLSHSNVTPLHVLANFLCTFHLRMLTVYSELQADRGCDSDWHKVPRSGQLQRDSCFDRFWMHAFCLTEFEQLCEVVLQRFCKSFYKFSLTRKLGYRRRPEIEPSVWIPVQRLGWQFLSKAVEMFTYGTTWDVGRGQVAKWAKNDPYHTLILLIMWCFSSFVYITIVYFIHCRKWSVETEAMRKTLENILRNEYESSHHWWVQLVGSCAHPHLRSLPLAVPIYLKCSRSFHLVHGVFWTRERFR